MYIDNVDAINVLNYDSSLVVEIDDNVLDYAIYGFERNGFAYKAHFDGPTFIGYISDLNNKYTDECGISYWKYEDSTIARMAYDGKLKDLVPLSDRYGFIPPYPSFAYDGTGSRTEEDLELPRLIEIFMQDDILKIELRYNTCILKNLVKFKPDMTKSEWMKEFESFVCSGLLAAVIPLAGEFFVPMAIEGFALSQEETVRRFGSGFCREAVSKYLRWAFKKLAENTDSLVVCIDSIRSVNEQYPDSIDVLWTAVIPWVYSNISFAKFIEERFTVPNLDDPNNPVVDFWGDCTKAGIANLVQAEEYKLLLGCLTNIRLF